MKGKGSRAWALAVEHQCTGEGRCQRSSRAWSCRASILQPARELRIQQPAPPPNKSPPFTPSLHHPLCPALPLPAWAASNESFKFRISLIFFFLFGIFFFHFLFTCQCPDSFTQFTSDLIPRDALCTGCHWKESKSQHSQRHWCAFWDQPYWSSRL